MRRLFLAALAAGAAVAPANAEIYDNTTLPIYVATLAQVRRSLERIVQVKSETPFALRDVIGGATSWASRLSARCARMRRPS